MQSGSARLHCAYNSSVNEQDPGGPLSGLSITATLAVATLFQHAGDAAGLVGQAEQAMIQATRKGRNHVQLAAAYAPAAGNSSLFSGLQRVLVD